MRFCLTFLARRFTNKNMKTELLAPAGDIECAYAALHFGADALYLGLKNFSARATATNFSEDELNEITAYAHYLHRKIYVTVNTLLQEAELPDLIRMLDICSRYKVDAVILQDLGVARVIKEQYKELEMHASTQMAVHNYEGALTLKELGFSRVVLARELTLDEINKIASIEGLETEVFIHGALCYSYSGICQFSSVEYGKSANRGKCLYPCRACFETKDGSEHIFSMKDMALEKDILRLKATSLKIEGRKKSALYVAAVTDYYRQILDGEKPDIKKAENIKQIFSRPWCKFHLNGKIKEVVDPDFVGHRGLLIGQIESIQKGKFNFKPTHDIGRFDGLQIDVKGDEKPFGFSVQKMYQNKKSVLNAKKGELTEIELPKGYPFLTKGMPIYLASSSFVKGAYNFNRPKAKEFQNKINISVVVDILKDRVCAKSGKAYFEIKGAFDKAVAEQKVYDAFKGSFEKTGDTLFDLQKFELNNPEKLFVPLSVINELRRGLYQNIVPEFKNGQLPKVSEPIKNKKAGFVIKVDRLEYIEKIDVQKFDEIIYLISEKIDFEKIKKIPKNKLRIALPAVCRNPDVFKKSIAELLQQGYKKWEISNYWGLTVLKEKNIDLSFGPFLYMMNTQALMMAFNLKASRISFSIEDTIMNIKDLALKSPVKTSFIIYQDVPLFTSAVCIRNGDCSQCKRDKKWIDLNYKGNSYHALSTACQTMLFKEDPYCAASLAKEINSTYYQMDFCYKSYNSTEVFDITQKLMNFIDIHSSTKANLLKTSI